MKTNLFICSLMLIAVAGTFLSCEKDSPTRHSTFTLRDSLGNANEVKLALTGDTLIITAARCGEGFKTTTTKLARGLHCTGNCFGEVDWVWAYQQYGTVVTFFGQDSLKYEINSCILRYHAMFDCVHCEWSGRRK